MRAVPVGPSVELPTGPRNAVLGVPKQRHAESKGKEGEEGGGGGGGRKEGRKETRGTVSSKRGPNTTGWLGKKYVLLFCLISGFPDPGPEWDPRAQGSGKIAKILKSLKN